VNLTYNTLKIYVVLTVARNLNIARTVHSVKFNLSNQIFKHQK